MADGILTTETTKAKQDRQEGEFEQALTAYKLAEDALNHGNEKEDSEAYEQVQRDFLDAYDRMFNCRASTGDEFIRKLRLICSDDNEYETLPAKAIKDLISEALAIGGRSSQGASIAA